MTKRDALTIPIGTPLREAERLLIEATLHDTGGNIASAARILQIDRSTLHKKLNQYRRSDRSALSGAFR
jgi:DNA-binding NtrC family response regulator